jgi:hypothetical protein
MSLNTKLFLMLFHIFLGFFACVLFVKRVLKNKVKIIGERVNEKNLGFFVVGCSMLFGGVALFWGRKQGNRQF